MKKTINAQIVADSINQMGDRITTYLLTYPRFIHAELMTHRMFSRNSASSRAIPFKRMLQMVKEDPFIPIAWQKDHPGMQGIEYWNINDQLTGEPGVYYYSPFGVAQSDWLNARDNMVEIAKHMNNSAKITKQICNRLLEPFMWHTVLVTAIEYDNFFELRCPKYEFGSVYYKSRIDLYNNVNSDIDAWPHEEENWWRRINKSQAEIHIQALAESMWDAKNESTPKILRAGEWHIPFGDNMDEDKIEDLLHGPYRASYVRKEGDVQQAKIEISTARCARLSYMTFNNEIDYEKDIQLHDRLLLDKHMSPFEHCAKAMNEEEYFSFIKGEVHFENNVDYITIVEENPSRKIVGWCNNFKGFIPYRYMIENS